MRKGGAADLCFAQEDPAVELVNHAGDIHARLRIGRNAVVLIDRCRTGVVGRERQCEIVVIAGEKGIEVGGTTADILIGLVAVVNPEVICRARQELHEPLCSGVAEGVRITAAFCLDKAGEEIHVEIVVLTGVGEHLVEVCLTEFCVLEFGGLQRWALRRGELVDAGGRSGWFSMLEISLGASSR